MSKIRILHLIVDLDPGGAEVMLYRLLAKADRERFPARVLSLIPEGPFAEKIRALGVETGSLGMRRGFPGPRALLRLVRLLRRNPPDLLQTWMYHADLLGGVAARLAGGIPVVWGVHHTNLEPGGNKRGTLWIARINARLSRILPRRIVCCSHATREAHARIGFAEDRMTVIPNGFDLSLYRPDPAARGEVRRALGLEEQTPVVGMIARFHPQKDHRTFLEAARRLAKRLETVRFVLCGKGITWENPELAAWVRAAGLEERALLLGPREDVPRLLTAFDVATLSSIGEAFPLVIGEAMACGVPCVATDVGDAARIVGETGEIVLPRDPRALAAAWERLLRMEPARRAQLATAARRRIEDYYSLDKIVRMYENLWVETVKK